MSSNRNIEVGGDAPDMSEEAAVGKNIIAESGGNKFAHLCLYNSLVMTGDTSEGVEGLMTIYGNLLGLHGFMAGFQYVALDGEINVEGDGSVGDTIELVIFSLRYFGFLVSLAGTIVCIIIQEYLKTIQHETIECQVRGIIGYAGFIQFGDYTAILATGILAVTCNLLLWRSSIPIPDFLAVAFNCISFLLVAALLRGFYAIIVRKQTGRLIYADPLYIKARENKNL